MGKVFGIISIIIGILSIVFYFWVLGIILGPIAILFGLIGLFKDDSKTLSIIGIILGIIGIILSIIIIVLVIILIREALNPANY